MTTPSKQHFLSSVPAFRAREERRSETDPLGAAKRRIAIVRTLADELERCIDRGEAIDMIHAQLVQELECLIGQNPEAVALMTVLPLADEGEDSGIRLVASRK